MLGTILLLVFTMIYQVSIILLHNMTNNDNFVQDNKIYNFILDLCEQIFITVLSILNIYLKCDTSIFDYILLIITVIGLIIRYKAYYDLGEFFTFDIRVNHILVNTGIYKYVAHPGYVGSLLLSFLIFMNINFILAIIFIIGLLYMYKNRIVAEKKLLSENIDNYADYVANTNTLYYITFITITFLLLEQETIKI